VELNPWKIRPYQLVNWWDMAKFDGSTFCLICGHLRGLEKYWEENRETSVSDAALKSIIEDIEFTSHQCKQSGLANSTGYIEDNLPLLRSVFGKSVGYGYITKIFGNLAAHIRAEMKQVEFLTVDKPKFYGNSSLFDSVVTDIFPQLTYDVVEAGNCLALNRTTACVFHLMRIMEFGVQRLGDKLKVPLVNETVWQKIMDQVNARIKIMPEKPAAKKRMKELYADVAGHLYNVKVAWRNTVMHPKRTYTPEEAERLFEAVKSFMAILVPFLKPKTTARLKELPNVRPADIEAMRDVMGTFRSGPKTTV
jgi:hypothetical protein